MKTVSFRPGLGLLGTCALLLTIAPGPAADLVATVFTSTGEPVAARTVQVSWTAANGGGSTLSTWWYDRVYFSTNNTWEAADPMLVSDYISRTLAPGSNYTRTASFTLPDVPEGRYWLVLRIDTSNTINETNEANNQLVIPIDIVVPDLAVADFRLLSGGLWEGLVRVGWTVTNQGSGSAKSWWYDRLYFSTNEVWEAGDVQLEASYENRTVTPGGSYGRTNTYTLPATSATVAYLILRTDSSDGVFEAAEANNTAVLPLGEAVLAPPLSIRWVPPKVELYWPTSAVGFVLEGTSGLGLGAVWTPTTNAVLTSGTNCLVNMAPIETLRFFRLKK